MKGNSEHEVFRMKDDESFVCIANNTDSHYWQGFENYDELDRFILELQKVALEAFGPRRITMQQLIDYAKGNEDDPGTTQEP